MLISILYWWWALVGKCILWVIMIVSREWPGGWGNIISGGNSEGHRSPPWGPNAARYSLRVGHVCLQCFIHTHLTTLLTSCLMLILSCSYCILHYLFTFLFYLVLLLLYHLHFAISFKVIYFPCILFLSTSSSTEIHIFASKLPSFPSLSIYSILVFSFWMV